MLLHITLENTFVTRRWMANYGFENTGTCSHPVLQLRTSYSWFLDIVFQSEYCRKNSRIVNWRIFLSFLQGVINFLFCFWKFRKNLTSSSGSDFLLLNALKSISSAWIYRTGESYCLGIMNFLLRFWKHWKHFYIQQFARTSPSKCFENFFLIFILPLYKVTNCQMLCVAYTTVWLRIVVYKELSQPTYGDSWEYRGLTQYQMRKSRKEQKSRGSYEIPHGKKKTAYFGHVIREGSRKFGWIKNTKEGTGIWNFEELVVAARNRTLDAVNVSLP